MNSCVISVTKTNTTQWRCKLINQLGVVQKSYDVFGNVSDELQYPWRIELVTFMRAIDLKPLRFLSEIHNSSDSDVTKLHSNSCYGQINRLSNPLNCRQHQKLFCFLLLKQNDTYLV
eukprot:702319_1